jgi:hypothetical protein
LSLAADEMSQGNSSAGAAHVWTPDLPFFIANALDSSTAGTVRVCVCLQPRSCSSHNPYYTCTEEGTMVYAGRGSDVFYLTLSLQGRKKGGDSPVVWGLHLERQLLGTGALPASGGPCSLGYPLAGCQYLQRRALAG